MATNDPIIEELMREQANLVALQMAVNTRQVRVTQHPPGQTPIDITQQYADGLRKASDALNKAVQVLKNLDA